MIKLEGEDQQLWPTSMAKSGLAGTELSSAVRFRRLSSNVLLPVGFERVRPFFRGLEMQSSEQALVEGSFRHIEAHLVIPAKQ